MSLELTLFRYEATTLLTFYWDLSSYNFGWGVDSPDRGICGFAATVQANDGIDKVSPQQLPFACCQIHDSLIMLPFGTIHSLSCVTNK
jgi:hypothetical protein